MAVAIRHPSRALAVLAVALPVPLLAAAGLSLPLPATVERLAAKLVPFGDPAALDAATGERPTQGTIVLASGEHHPSAAQLNLRAATHAPRLIGAPASHAGAQRSQVSPRNRDQSAAAPIASPTKDAAPAPAAVATTTTSAAPTPTTTPTTATTPPTATTPTTTTAPSPPATVPTVTTEVKNTVTTATSTANNTVTTVTNNVGGVVGGLPHP